MIRFVAVVVSIAGMTQLPSLSATAHDPTGAALGPGKVAISNAINLAAEYMLHACAEDGRFVYKVNDFSGSESPSYNVIRHEGAMYALALLYRKVPDPTVPATMLRAANYLRQTYLSGGERPRQMILWSEPLPERGKAELGAIGLGLVALSEAYRIYPDQTSLQELEGLGQFILSLQKSDGSFFSLYLAGSGPVEGWQSLYYPGEAVLGLLSLYELDHSPAWLGAATKGLFYVARSRSGLPTVPADHWALIATAKLFEICARSDCPGSREELLTHTRQICDSILREQIAAPGSPLDGAFDLEGRTAPAATRMEGLLAALEFLPPSDEPLRQRIKTASDRGVGFLVRTQVVSGKYAGGVPGASVAGSRGASEIRIDYVQHALSAWLRYQAVNSR